MRSFRFSASHTRFRDCSLSHPASPGSGTSLNASCANPGDPAGNRRRDWRAGVKTVTVSPHGKAGSLRGPESPPHGDFTLYGQVRSASRQLTGRVTYRRHGTRTGTRPGLRRRTRILPGRLTTSMCRGVSKTAIANREFALTGDRGEVHPEIVLSPGSRVSVQRLRSIASFTSETV